MRRVKLYDGETVLAVVPDRCAGPGWSNNPVWVHIASPDGTYRTDCLQPHEQNAELLTLFAVGVAVHTALIDSVPISRVSRRKEK